MVPRVKGTQDFLECRLFNYMVDTIRTHLACYRYTEIKTPILEHVDLFKRALGVYTDVVTKEMFTIRARDDQAEQICLRPEFTAPTVRAFIEHGIEHRPWKVFSYGPAFRYERPQKGRYRQFHQLSIELIGAPPISYDAECIKMLDRLFHEQFNLNNYALELNFLGCFEDRKAYKILLKEFLQGLVEKELCATCLTRKDANIMRVFDCKNGTCQQMYKNAPFIAENLCTQCATEWDTLKEQLELLAVSYAYQPRLVRGLDYYNKTVFEFSSANLGAQNAFCGGGRYDQLVGQLGAKHDQPSIGAAIGLERLMLLLEPMQDQLPIAQEPPLHVIMPMAQEQQALALLVADVMQAKNLCVDVLLGGDSVKNMMRKANKLGAATALIIGEQEQQDKTVMVKNMMTGAQEVVAQIDIVSYLKK